MGRKSRCYRQWSQRGADLLASPPLRARDRLTALIVGLEAEISELQAQIENQNEQIRVSSLLVSSVTGLRAKGIMSELEYRQRELAALEQKQKLNSLNQQFAARQNQLTETRYSLEQLPTVMAGRIQSLR